MKPLTRRQLEVLALVANGTTNTGIGRTLGIHRVTVDRHLAETYISLGARDRAHAVAIALITGQLNAQHVQLPQQEAAA